MQIRINILYLKERMQIECLINLLLETNIAYMMGDWHGVKSGNT